MKIKKLGLSDKVVLAVAEDIAYSFTIPKYEQFLTKHDLLSYNPDDYSRFNKIDYIRDTLGEIDVRLFVELDKTNFLSDETKEALVQEEVAFENFTDTRKSSVVYNQDSQPFQAEKSQKYIPTPPMEPETETSTDRQKTSLLGYAIVFLIVLIALGVLWKFFPDSIIFILLIFTSVIVFFSIVIASLKHDGKISDNTFVNAIVKIAEMVKTFVKR